MTKILDSDIALLENNGRTDLAAVVSDFIVKMGR